ncbi:MAG: hypothetical protein LBL07_07625 [Tannerella sp.]|jgi:hypothetical protein|nr:hypothetical protein [Tannerella sp.]
MKQQTGSLAGQDKRRKWPAGIFALLFLLLSVCVRAQTGSDSVAGVDTALLNIYKQLMVFPQEKIYVQTDRPYYTAGETVFYRLFLLDACFHVPFPVSRYVYVELIDQAGSVEVRRKLRPENGGMYYGAFKLSGHLAQGYYKIRAYTRFMENRGVENFYSKPLFVMAENRERLKMEMNASAAGRNRTSVELRFVDAGTGAVATRTDGIFLQLNGKKHREKDRRDDGVFEFDLPLTDEDRDRNLYVEALNGDDSVIFKQFDRVPYTGDSIELTFYPEGGYMVEGQPNVVAFKALARDGRPAEIRGNIVTSDSTLLTKFATAHEGMGLFFLLPEKGKTCYAEYESGDKRYRMQLSGFKWNPFSLHSVWRNGKLWISVNREKDARLPAMYLLVHCRGDMLYFGRWDEDKPLLSLEKELLRTGVNHLILLSGDYRPLSERLVFCNKNDHLRPEIKADKPAYRKREPVVLDISLDGATALEDSLFYGDDDEGMMNLELPEIVVTNKRIRRKSKRPGTYGPDLAVSVTADNEVQIDTTTNILTEILLESELAGTVANPAWYFGNSPGAEAGADLLMMTHGWTRYDIPKAMRGEWTVPEIDAETSQTLSGRVQGKLIPRAAANTEVSVMSFQGKEKYYDITKTDKNGLFRFEDFELPDSSEIVIQALKGEKRKKGMLEVVTDTVEYPLAGDFGFPQYCIKTSGAFVEQLIAATDRRYSFVNGERMITLPEIVVKARNPNRKPQKENVYHAQPDFFLTAGDIKETGITDLLTLISTLPYVTVRHRGWQTSIETFIPGGFTGSGRTEATLAINGIVFQGDVISPLSALSLVNINEIAEIHLIIDPGKLWTTQQAVGFINVVPMNNIGEKPSAAGGTPTPSGLINIITKDGKFYDRRQRFHFKSLMPLGYATPAAFYSPRYDPPGAPPGDPPDLRTTIYWQPDVTVTGDDKASIRFYTADTPTAYSIVTQGICLNGTLIYRHEKAVVSVGK